MSCTDIFCSITRYETEWVYTAKPVSAGEDCDLWTKEEINNRADAHVKSYLSDKYPDTPTDCGKGCKCLEIEDQDPKATKWAGWIKHAGNFPMDTGSFANICRVGYEIKYKYRNRVFKGNCGIDSGPTFGNPTKDKPSPKDVVNYDPKYHSVSADAGNEMVGETVTAEKIDGCGCKQ